MEYSRKQEGRGSTSECRVFPFQLNLSTFPTDPQPAVMRHTQPFHPRTLHAHTNTRSPNHLYSSNDIWKRSFSDSALPVIGQA